VRLIDEAGEQVGIVARDAALTRAQDQGLDLVEVAPDAHPPVCRIMDYSKYVYEQKRKQKQARKKTHHQDTKEVKVRPNIDKHDFEFKLKHAREFLGKGHKVKLTLRYRMRELRHQEIGDKVVNSMIQALADMAAVESQHRVRNSRLQTVILAPRKAAVAEEKPKGAPQPQASETEGR
jgi:translation initiation factor IF-3